MNNKITNPVENWTDEDFEILRDGSISAVDWEKVAGTVEEILTKKDNKMKDNNWIDLDINNIPSDFFVNERYEVERCSIYGSEEWTLCTTVATDRWKQIQIAIEGQIKYRYRLKELEPIRVTKEDMLILSNYYFNEDMTKDDFEKACCRQVIIID